LFLKSCVRGIKRTPSETINSSNLRSQNTEKQPGRLSIQILSHKRFLSKHMNTISVMV
jgi:hypothetical protein